MSVSSSEPPEPSQASGGSERAGLQALNALPAEAARLQLLACCSSARWADEVASGRPFASAAELFARSDQAVAGLAQADLEQALAGHPRIGRPAGPAHGWSRRRCVPHGGHQFALNIAVGLGLGGNESYPQVFAPFGGFADNCKVVDSRVAMPDIPGIGFEAKNELYKVVKQLLN